MAGPVANTKIKKEKTKNGHKIVNFQKFEIFILHLFNLRQIEILIDSKAHVSTYKGDWVKLRYVESKSGVKGYT